MKKKSIYGLGKSAYFVETISILVLKFERRSERMEFEFDWKKRTFKYTSKNFRRKGFVISDMTLARICIKRQIQTPVSQTSRIFSDANCMMRNEVACFS